MLVSDRTRIDARDVDAVVADESRRYARGQSMRIGAVVEGTLRFRRSVIDALDAGRIRGAPATLLREMLDAAKVPPGRSL